MLLNLWDGIVTEGDQTYFAPQQVTCDPAVMAHPSSVEYYCSAIRDVTQTISEKCQVLGDILATSQSKFRAVELDARTKVFQRTSLVDEMDFVFEQLQGIAVTSSVDAAPGKTLFDYVDAETVQALQQDAVDQTKEIEEMLAMHRDALDRIAAIYEYFSSFQKKHGAQLSHVTQAPASQVEVTTLEHLYDTAVRFFVDMEQCDRFLLRYFSTINDVYPVYEGALNEAETLFDELRSLQEFYRQFYGSYMTLGNELRRRRGFDDKVTKLLHDTMAKLHIYEQEEQQARLAFAQEHGRFLPSSLCPELKNPPDQYELVKVEHSESSA